MSFESDIVVAANLHRGEKSETRTSSLPLPAKGGVTRMNLIYCE